MLVISDIRVPRSRISEDFPHLTGFRLYALVLTLLFIGIGWYLILRPQQQRLREQREMQTSLAVGDRVVSAGGIHGTLTVVDQDTVQMVVAPGVAITLARPAVVRTILTEGSDDADGGAPPAVPLEDDTMPDDPTTDGGLA